MPTLEGFGADENMSKREFGVYFVALSIIATVMWAALWLLGERDLIDYGGILLVAIMWLTAVVLYTERRASSPQSSQRGPIQLL